MSPSGDDNKLNELDTAAESELSDDNKLNELDTAAESELTENITTSAALFDMECPAADIDDGDDDDLQVAA